MQGARSSGSEAYFLCAAANQGEWNAADGRHAAPGLAKRGPPLPVRGSNPDPVPPARGSPVKKTGRKTKRDWAVGCAGFGVKLEDYFEKFGAVEVQETFLEPPARRTLERWRRMAPESFAFVVRAWQLLTHPEDAAGYRRMRCLPEWAEKARVGFFRPGDQLRRAWESVRETCEVLAARAVVFDTPASFTPGPEHRENLVRFFSDLPRGREHLVWQPEGMWEEEEVASLCKELELIPAMDPLVSSLSPGKVFYFRFPTRTRVRGRYTEDDFFRIVQALEAKKRAGKEGFFIWSAPDGWLDARRFQSWLATGQSS